MSVEECFMTEYALALRCTMPSLCGHFDFQRAVKVRLIDKVPGGSVEWEPSSVPALSPSIITEYFAPLPSDIEPLDLHVNIRRQSFL